MSGITAMVNVVAVTIAKLFVKVSCGRETLMNDIVLLLPQESVFIRVHPWLNNPRPQDF